MGRRKNYERSSPELYSGDTELVEGKMQGFYSLLGTGYSATYSLTANTSTKSVPAYPIRGTVSLRNTETGAVIKASGSALRKITAKSRWSEKSHEKTNEDNGEEIQPRKKRTDDYKLSMRVACRSEDPELLRSIIAEKSWKLFQSNEAQLVRAPTDGARTDAINLNRLEIAYIDDYLRLKKQKERKRRMLEDVGQALGSVPVGKITHKQLDDVRKNLGGSWKSKICEAANFLDHVYELRRDGGDSNVFRDYLELRPETVDTRKLQNRATEKPSLTPGEESRLIQMAIQHPDNVIAVAAATIVCTRLDAFYISGKMTFGDFENMIEFPDIVIVKLYKENVTGAVHDFSFPTRPLFRKVIDARRSWLVQHGIQPGPETPFICYVVGVGEACRDAKIEPGKLTDGIRNLLANMDVKKSVFDQARMTDEDDRSGAGIKLLKGTYDKYLSLCGLTSDVALKRFLQHKSLRNSVQANYYRSFTDPTARYCIAVALMRKSSDRKAVAGIGSKICRGRTKTTIKPAASSETLIAELHIRLKPGEKLEVFAQHGCTLRAAPVDTESVLEEGEE